MPVLDVTDLSKNVADRTLFSDVTFTIRRGEKVGLVGLNGSGKSTLGRVLAGIDEPDTGRLSRRREATFEYLEQEPRFEKGRTIREVVLESLGSWNETRARFDQLTEALSTTTDDAELARLAAEQAEVGEALERQGGWDRAHEAEATIGHLGLPDPDRIVDTLSGGEARRAALARLLVAKPDLAILDEPTNHLDLDTIEWLEETLRDRFAGALLLISHDRSVLDAVTTRTLEVHEGTVHDYDGGYGLYLVAKAERMAHAERAERNRQNFLRREVEWLRRAPKARGTKQKARIGRAEDALSKNAPKQERTAELKLRSQRQGKTILEFAGLSVAREGAPLFSGLDLALRPGERIGIVGPNGCGKTTLLLAALGELPPASGEIIRGATTQIGYLDQARRGLDDTASVREAALGEATFVDLGAEQVPAATYLERFLFDRKQQRVRVGELSGGERARVCLARLLAAKSNLLLLDEPTNDLDVATLGALEAMLVDFGGSVLLVSHDRWLLDRVATSILSFEPGGRLDLQVGNYADYRERMPRRTRGRDAAKTGEAVSDGGARRGTREAPETAEPRESAGGAGTPSASPRLKPLHAKERRELEGLLDRIDSAEQKVAALQEALADPAIYQSGGDEAERLRGELENAEAEVDTLSSRWEELEARASSE